MNVCMLRFILKLAALPRGLKHIIEVFCNLGGNEWKRTSRIKAAVKVGGCCCALLLSKLISTRTASLPVALLSSAAGRRAMCLMCRVCSRSVKAYPRWSLLLNREARWHRHIKRCQLHAKHLQKREWTGHDKRTHSTVILSPVLNITDEWNQQPYFQRNIFKNGYNYAYY